MTTKFVDCFAMIVKLIEDGTGMVRIGVVTNKMDESLAIYPIGCMKRVQNIDILAFNAIS
jgi:hypothetical protein